MKCNMKRSIVTRIATYIAIACMIGNIVYWVDDNLINGLSWYASMLGVLGMSGSIGLMLFFVWLGILRVIDIILRD